MRGCGSDRLDVYEISAGVIQAMRCGAPGGVRFLRRDINLATLPTNQYDVVWSSGTLHHVINLEALFDEVARALRPGALFALRDYVGEARLEYEPHRLALARWGRQFS
jgi:SAM-dependent methyltransferase